MWVNTMMVFEEEAVGGFRCDWWLESVKLYPR